MALCVERYMEKGRRYRVLDVGARVSLNQKLTHRQLLAGYDVDYTGVDVRAGQNVDVVMKKPYRIPMRSGSVDVVFSGQTFEHIAFPWASILEIARVLAPGGVAFITAPSRGHVHGTYDCWRYHPDGMRALGAWSGLDTVEAHTDFPVGVFRKPLRHRSLSTPIMRAVVLWWANRVGHLPDASTRPAAPSRDDVLGLRAPAA
jgi:SAM-dependent methyltransferase